MPTATTTSLWRSGPPASASRSVSVDHEEISGWTHMFSGVFNSFLFYMFSEDIDKELII